MKREPLFQKLYLCWSYFLVSQWGRLKSMFPPANASKKSCNTEIPIWKKPSTLCALPVLCLTIASALELNSDRENSPPLDWAKLEISLPCSVSEPGLYEAFGDERSYQFFLSASGAVYAPSDFQPTADIQTCVPIQSQPQIEEIL